MFMQLCFCMGYLHDNHADKKVSERTLLARHCLKVNGYFQEKQLSIFNCATLLNGVNS